MPEGDTLARTAAGLRPYLVGREVSGAKARAPGPQVDRLVGSTVTGVESMGKNLLIRFDNGLEVRTHLRMRGSWHRYRPGEAWRRPPGRAVLVLEVPGSVAVCFDAPVVELFEQRTEALHPSLSKLGPDLLADPVDVDEAMRRLRSPERADLTSPRRCSTSGRWRGSATRSRTWCCGRPGSPRGRRSGTSTTPRCEAWWIGAPRSCASAPRRAAGRWDPTAGPGARARDAGRSCRRRSSAASCRA